MSSIKKDAAALYLMGDTFDYWFEYKTVVPKGFLRLFAKLIEFKEAEIEIFMFTGNHDLWMKDYFEKELQIPVFHHPIVKEIYGKKFFLGHGDGLGPGDTKYKILKKYFFTNPFIRFCYRQLHPDLTMRIASWLSRKSRTAQDNSTSGVGKKFKRKEKEWLFLYAQKKIQETHYDYFIFGHRHLPLNLELGGGSKYINTGDWIKFYSYAKFDGEQLELLYYKE